MNKHSDRALELSAKKALSLWRYPEEAGGDKFLEIEFEFNLEQWWTFKNLASIEF